MALAKFKKVVQDIAGNVVPGATVTVTMSGSGAAATLYSDSAGLSPILGNAVLSNANGEVQFYIAPTTIDLVGAKNGTTIFTTLYESVAAGPEGESISMMRDLTFAEELSVRAGLGALDLSAKMQSTLNYAASLKRMVKAIAGTIKCNVTIPAGCSGIEGEGRGLPTNFTGPVPQVPNYTFTGGGTTFVPANTDLPCIKASGTGGASGWPIFTLRNLKVSCLAGSLVAGSIGILAELSSNFSLENVDVRNLATGVQMSSAGKTAWSWKIDNVTIADCGIGLDASAATQNATPMTINNLDVRRCTVIGAKFDKFTCLGWYGGTVADNYVGVQLLGDTNGEAIVGFCDIQWETNEYVALSIGGGGADFPGGPITVRGGHFVDYRGSAGDGSVWPSIFAGSRAIEYNVNEPTSRLILEGVGFSAYAKCVDYAGQGVVTRIACRMYQCTEFGKIVSVGSANDLEDAEFGAANNSSYVSIGRARMTVKSNDFSVYAFNYYIQPIDTNGSIASGLLTRGTGNFAQWAVHNGPDPDNAAFLALEHGSNYAKVYSDKRGTGTRRKLTIQSAGGTLALFDGTGVTQSTGWGTPTNGALVTNFNASTATLEECAQVLSFLLAHWKQRGDLGA